MRLNVSCGIKKIIASISMVCIGLLSTSQALAGSWQNGVSLGGFNNVNIYTPDTDSPVGSGKALMLVLHGCVQPINNFLTANLEDAAEQYGMVIAVPDAINKAGFSCWSYWQGTKSRTSGDYQNLISLANTMSGDASRNIDPDQVYIAGLSSGASFANTTACLAPDVFAGVGVSAGPSIGTSSNGALGPCESADVQARCNSYAGSFGSFFSTQIASIAHGDADDTVNQCYNTQNSDGMAAVYGVSKLPGTNTISEGVGRTAQETLWEDGRVSMLWFNGVDHAWSGGEGASGGYISSASINYATYLGEYFSENNKRVNRNQPPEVSNLSLSANSDTISVSADITDAEGSVTSATAVISNVLTGNVVENVTLLNSGGALYNGDSGSLSDALYNVSVTATDNEGAVSDEVSETVRVGPEPPATAPVLSNISVSVSAQCATVSGTVFDENQNLDTVTAAFANGSVTAAVNGTSYSAEQCSLPGGSNTVTVTATDSGGLSSTDSTTFDIDAGQVATLDQHIAAGRLDYTNYANCYLEYGASEFKLNEISISSSLCRWQDDDASCVGPDVACQTGGGSGGGNGGGGNGGGGSNCVEETTFNYYHKTAGRAYSTGPVFTPDYFANGSDDPMAGSTWGNTTLYSTDGGTVWNVGNCP